MTTDMEPIRRKLATALQWGGWGGALGVFVFATIEYDPTEGHFAPQWVGLSFIFLIGVAISGGAARSRMRITDVIVDALKTGMRSERASMRGERKAMERERESIRSDLTDPPNGDSKTHRHRP